MSLYHFQIGSERRTKPTTHLGIADLVTYIGAVLLSERIGSGVILRAFNEKSYHIVIMHSASDFSRLSRYYSTSIQGHLNRRY